MTKKFESKGREKHQWPTNVSKLDNTKGQGWPNFPAWMGKGDQIWSGPRMGQWGLRMA